MAIYRQEVIIDTMKIKLYLYIFLLLLISSGARGESGEMFEVGESGSTFSNLTLTCAERNIEISRANIYSPAVTTLVKVFRITYFTLLFMIGNILNIFVFFLVAKHKKLHTLSFGIILQVIVLNLLFSVFVFLPIVVTAGAERWLLGKEVCVLTGFISFTLLMVRTSLMLVFVIDRFLSVFVPYFYPMHKVKITVSLSAFSWVLVLVVNIFGLPGILDCYTYITSSQFCNISSSCNQACSIFGTSYFVILGLPCTITSLILYGALYWKGRRLQKHTATTAAANAPVMHHSSEEVQKREWRATITFFLLFLSVFLITVPSTAIGIIIAQISSTRVLPPAGFVIQAIVGAISALLVLTDPIVLMRNRDIREIRNEFLRKLFEAYCCPRCAPNAE